jgi:tetratricopeptide (TPR) repeat protein
MNRSLAVVTVLAAFGAGALYLYQARRGEPPPSAVSAIPVTAGVGMQLLPGLGDLGFTITTANPDAQRWFNQGLVLIYGFNHDASERSFLKAIELDPECAMCWWGAAIVIGPNINATMDPADAPKAWSRLQKALQYSSLASPREQGFIQALFARYAENPPADRKPLDIAYAEAMRQLAKARPDDLDAQTMSAEALMDLHPWDYYDQEGKAKEWAPEFVALLELVMARDPKHPGANHYYIHAVEASDHPDRGLPSADRLLTLFPGAGHLVHMPAHIYMRTGRYHDASLANQGGIKSDNAYLAICKPGGLYPMGYVPHNHHFLWASSSMEGASKTALAAADETARRTVVLIRTQGFGAVQHYWVAPMFGKVRFGLWDEILETPAPDADLPYPTAVWHYAQGMARIRKSQFDEAQRHYDALAKFAADPVMEKLTIWDLNTFAAVLKVAERALAGELAAARKDYATAVAALQQGVEAELALHYDEPAPWHYPLRHSLGAVLLAADKPEEAAAVYRQDLKANRDNGWSLFGLAQALRAQNKTADAAQAEERFKKAWANADVQLSASRF